MLLCVLQNWLSFNNNTTISPDPPARNRNGEESLKEEILAQSFENNQPNNTAPMKITVPTTEGMNGILLTSVIPILVPPCFLPFCWQMLRTFDFVNIQWFFSILVSVIYIRESSLESDEKEKINQLMYDDQHNDGNAKNQEKEMATLPKEKSKNIDYQILKTQTPKIVGGKQYPSPRYGFKTQTQFHEWFLKIYKYKKIQ